MATRLEARLAKCEEKLAPGGGSNVLRSFTEMAGKPYSPEPGDEAVTVQTVVREGMRRYREERAREAAAEAKTEAGKRRLN